MAYTIAVADSGRQFTATPDETVLDAADRAGVAMPWRCASGTCGSCRTWLVDGECVDASGVRIAAGKPPTPRPGVLLCQARPRSDLALQARAVARVEDLACRAFELEVTAKRALSPRVLRVDLAVRGPTLRWLPGQYLELLLDDGQRRAFSIANAARGDNGIELHIRHAAGGHFSQWVAQALEVGMRLRAEGPFGTFVPRENAERGLLFIAGGTGVAPIKAMIEHFVRLGSRRSMQLYWGVRTARGLYLERLLEHWSTHTPRFGFVPVISAPVAPLPSRARAGMVLDAVLADHASLSDFDVYVCGPPAMVDAATRVFAATDLPPAQLHLDNYRQAPERLARILEQRAGLRLP